MQRRAVVLFAACLAVACTEPHPLGPDAAAAQRSALLADEIAQPPRGLTALTWNVYVGAEIERVIQAQTPEEAVALATEEWAHVRATNFPARAGALAAAIAARRPHIVGLEELALYRTTDRPFEELANHVAYDFLQLVLDSLHAHGTFYAKQLSTGREIAVRADEPMNTASVSTVPKSLPTRYSHLLQFEPPTGTRIPN